MLNTAPRINAFDMHPLDYTLVQKAAATQGMSIADFVMLSIYLNARDVVAAESEAVFYLSHAQDHDIGA